MEAVQNRFPGAQYPQTNAVELTQGTRLDSHIVMREFSLMTMILNTDSMFPALLCDFV